MDKIITVPFNKTSNEYWINKILQRQYIESFKNEITRISAEFNELVKESKWLKLTQDSWLYTPFNIIIYDPKFTPKQIYLNAKGKRFLKVAELKKAFYTEWDDNPLRSDDNGLVFMNNSKCLERTGRIIYGRDSYYWDYFLICSGETNHESSDSGAYIYADDMPKDTIMLLYALKNKYNFFEKNSKNKEFFDILISLYYSGALNVTDSIELAPDFESRLMSESYLDNEVYYGSGIKEFLMKVMHGEDTGCCGNLLKKDAITKLKTGTYELNNEIRDEYLNALLEYDNYRCGMDLYDETRLKDPNGGHWLLWEHLRENSNTKSVTGNSDNIDNNYSNNNNYKYNNNKKNNNNKKSVPEKKTQNNLSEQISTSIKTGWMARNPVADVKLNGVVGIDFGTKSTVVTYKDGSAKINPLRIGSGNYASVIKKEDYENPTVIEFKDIESFLDDYHGKEGRPATSWDDVTVSHVAAQQMKSPTSQELISSFFSDIKQWTMDPDRQVRIRDQKSFEKVLGQYRSLGDKPEFDPLEIYAYYLGLFINNMRQGIYLRYKLSYPAKAEIDLREKIRKSFERGLRKSLPQSVLNDEECMSKFKVELGMSEPAAYAISALRGYGFEDIEDDDSIFYGIFDFGGGTTDFDFGVWEPEIESRSYDYRITHFGENGDPYLGGENLIELLAFEVFKSNKDTLLEKHIVFSKPHNCNTFIGSEMLIANSREAIVNLKKLAEELRGYWHGNAETIDKLTKDGSITLMLWPREGDTQKNITLNIDVTMLDRKLDEQIDDGIKQFFIAIRAAFSESMREKVVGNPDKMHIFLAGNSSKSKRVIKLFKKHIDEYEREIVKQGGGEEGKNYIYFYPPLGTEAAKRIIAGKLKPLVSDVMNFECGDTKNNLKGEIKNVTVDDKRIVAADKTKSSDELIDSLSKPSGKTGVAFGLLDSKVHVIPLLSTEGKTAFKYYLGYEKRRKFKTVVSPETEYNIWVQYTDVTDRDEEELYYTELAEARTNKMDIESGAVKYINLSIDLKNAEEGAYIYIRAVDPAKIEYVVATEDEMNRTGGKFDVKRIKKIEISGH